MMQDRGTRWMAVGIVAVLVWMFTYWSWNPIEPASAVMLDTTLEVPHSSSEQETGSMTSLRTDDAWRIAEQPFSPGNASSITTPTPTPPLVLRNSPVVVEPRPLPPSQSAPASRSNQGVVAPSFRDYTIKPNDTFEGIARRELGSPSLVESIQRANPLRDPRRIRPGDVIRLPVDPQNIQGKLAGNANDASPTTPAPANFAEYVVVSGDTLSSIAQRLLGSSDQARAIFELNRDRLPSMNSIRIGQRLRVPVAPVLAPSAASRP